MENSASEINKAESLRMNSRQSKSQTSSHLNEIDHKKRYQAVIQQVKHKERRQVQENIVKKKKQEEKIQKLHLKSQIEKKKKELEQLEKIKNNESQIDNKAFNCARIKIEQQKVKKMEKEIWTETIQKMSKTRYNDAKRHFDIQKQQLNFKQTQAEHIRKTHDRRKKNEREQATRYSHSVMVRKSQNQQKEKENQIKTITNYQQSLTKHGLNKKLTASQSNVTTLVVKQKQSDYDAIRRAEVQQVRKSQKALKNQKQIDCNRQLAIQRGQKALQKIKIKKQYDDYCRQAEQEQKRYNLKRIQAGKVNQFAGVKCSTLSQMDLNKKIRKEKQFQTMFLKNTTKKDQNEPASKYKIVQTKMKNKQKELAKKQTWTKRQIDYMEHQSQIPGVSEGHYSFEEDRSIQNHEDYDNQQHNLNVPEPKEVIEPKPIIKETGEPNIIQTYGKIRMKQTRVSNNNASGKQAELNYSDSEQDSNI